MLCLITLYLLCLLFSMSLWLTISVSSLTGVLYVCSVWWSMFLTFLVFSLSALSDYLCFFSARCSALSYDLHYVSAVFFLCSQFLLCIIFSVCDFNLSDDLCFCSVWVFSVSALSDVFLVCSVWWSLCLLCLMISVSALSDNLCLLYLLFLCLLCLLFCVCSAWYSICLWLRFCLLC